MEVDAKIETEKWQQHRLGRSQKLRHIKRQCKDEDIGRNRNGIRDI